LRELIETDKVNHNLWEFNLKNDITNLGNTDIEENRIKNIYNFSGRYKKELKY
jgi:hypothetical protein